MIIESVEILGGSDREGHKEPVESVLLSMGQVASVVGPTGSGKTALITDIELFAGGDTPTGRKILINTLPPPAEMIDKPSSNPVAMITQHTNFLSDLPVLEFLKIHANIRKSGEENEVTRRTLEFANQLTGEPVNPDSSMTQLSGGQARALLIADAVIIGKSPILLLDEIENAGINRTKALRLLKRHKKIFIFVTHDPRIALLSDLRIVMAKGAMKYVIATNHNEKELAQKFADVDDLALGIKQKLWAGEIMTNTGTTSKLDGFTSDKALITGSFAPNLRPIPSYPEPTLIDKAIGLGRVFNWRSS